MVSPPPVPAGGGWPLSFWTVPLELPSPRRVAALRRAMEPSTPVRLGLVSNQGSGQSFQSPLSALGRVLPDAELVWQTRSPEHLVDAMRTLLFDAHVNVLAVAGGDGTLHHAVNLLVRIADELEARDGTRPALPLLLAMPGGTMNIFARAFGTRDVPLRAVARFHALFAGRPLCELPTRDVALLDVRSKVVGRVLGFVLGSALVLEALRIYESLGAGYAGLARFFGHLALGPTVGTELWRREGHRLGRRCGPLEVDGALLEGARMFTASTIPLRIARGALQLFGDERRVADRRGFPALWLDDVSDRALLGAIPALVAGRVHPAVHRSERVEHARFTGPFTVDGELFPRHETEEAGDPDLVEVRRLSSRLRFVSEG